MDDDFQVTPKANVGLNSTCLLPMVYSVAPTSNEKARQFLDELVDVAEASTMAAFGDDHFDDVLDDHFDDTFASFIPDSTDPFDFFATDDRFATAAPNNTDASPNNTDALSKVPST